MLALQRKRQKPCHASGFQNAEQGVAITLLLRCLGRLGSRSRGSSRRSTAFFGRRQIAGDLILADFKDYEFVGRHARTAAHVELHGLAGGSRMPPYEYVVFEVDRKSTPLKSHHLPISDAVFFL